MHVLALSGLINILIADPAPAVAGDLKPQFFERSSQFRVALQRDADAEHGER